MGPERFTAAQDRANDLLLRWTHKAPLFGVFPAAPVLGPESFRGDCSFGGGQVRTLPVRRTSLYMTIS